MSGGSMNYLCYRVEEEAERMGDPELIDIVKDIANLLHDREWFLSGDYGDGEWLTLDLTNLTPLVTHWMSLPELPVEVV